jgi:hypothetical protein
VGLRPPGGRGRAGRAHAVRTDQFNKHYLHATRKGVAMGGEVIT